MHTNRRVQLLGWLTPLLIAGSFGLTSSRPLHAQGLSSAQAETVRDAIRVLEDEGSSPFAVDSAIGDLEKVGPRCLVLVYQSAKAQKSNQAKLRLVYAGYRVISANANGGKAQIPDEALGFLKEFAGNSDGKEFVARYWSVKSLGGVRNGGTLEVLSKILEEGEVKQVLQIQALRSIGKAERGDEVLVQYIDSKEFRIREAACDACRGIFSKYALVCLFQGLVDADVRVRGAAIDSLAVLLDLPEVRVLPGVDKLRETLSNPDVVDGKAVRKWYDWIVAQKDLNLTAEDLIGFLKAPDPEINREVCGKLSGSKAPKVLFARFRLLTDEDRFVREAALKGLKELSEGKDLGLDPFADEKDRQEGEKAWFGFLLKEMGEFDWEPLARTSGKKLRASLCRCVTGMKTKRALRFLYMMLLAPEESVRTEAINAFNYLKTTVFKEEKPFAFDPAASLEVRNSEEQLPAVHEWMKQHKTEFTGP